MRHLCQWCIWFAQCCMFWVSKNSLISVWSYSSAYPDKSPDHSHEAAVSILGFYTGTKFTRFIQYGYLEAPSDQSGKIGEISPSNCSRPWDLSLLFSDTCIWFLSCKTVVCTHISASCRFWDAIWWITLLLGSNVCPMASLHELLKIFKV